MDTFTFEGMTPELRAYLDHDRKSEGGYEESARLRKLVQPGLLHAYSRAQLATYFVPANEDVTKRREVMSPSGRYKLVVGSFGTKPGCWSYTQGTLYRIGSDDPIAVVQRNYSSFPSLFIEGHPNGHDYWIGGEDYQGQTVVELDTGARRDHLPSAAEAGAGFCMAAATFDVTTKLLVIDGCIWACPYELRFYDFSDPMAGWPALECDECIDDDKRPPTFEPDGTIVCYQTECASDDDDDESTLPPIAAKKTFRRESNALVLVEEWVSEKEQARRARSAEAERKYELWLENFKTTDPLYLAYREHMKDPALSPSDYESHGFTYEGWCPTWTGNEKRWCRRIVSSKKSPSPLTIEFEWAVETGPVKLAIYRNGSKAEDRFFEHSVAGINEAFAYAKKLVQEIAS
jgi:hypothetical protein